GTMGLVNHRGATAATTTANTWSMGFTPGRCENVFDKRAGGWFWIVGDSEWCQRVPRGSLRRTPANPWRPPKAANTATTATPRPGFQARVTPTARGVTF